MASKNMQILTINLPVDHRKRIRTLIERGVAPSRSEVIRKGLWEYMKYLEKLIEHIFTEKEKSEMRGAPLERMVKDGAQYIKIPINGRERWVRIGSAKENDRSDRHDFIQPGDPEDRKNDNGSKSRITKGATRSLGDNGFWKQVFNGEHWVNVPLAFGGNHTSYIEIIGVKVPTLRIHDFRDNNEDILPDDVVDQINEIYNNKKDEIKDYYERHGGAYSA